jgi:predicted TIM-barrel fold metal-dependent hydrolase
MSVDRIKKCLLTEIEAFEIIDCHEHLGPEKYRTGSEVDVFNLFSHYTGGDMGVAGINEENRKALFNQNIPLDYRWSIFEPYWENFRYSSYAQASLIAASKFYGADDINKNTYQAITDAMKKANTPGIYERVLRKACNIRTSLTMCDDPKVISDTPLLTGLVSMPQIWDHQNLNWLLHPVFDQNACIRSLDDYLDVGRNYIKTKKAEGAVGMKMVSNPFEAPDRQEAIRIFNNILFNGGKAEGITFRSYIIDEMIKYCGQIDLPVAVHTGYWGDFRNLDPLHMIPMLQRHPNVKFDIFHLGYPWIRETIMLGKSFPNVWLNLCWAHIISKKATFEALDEIIDTVPVNKILGFGGDYLPSAVEKVYGHLSMARDNIAGVLAGRVAANHMTESQAITIAKKWLWDNPNELYKLGF